MLPKATRTASTTSATTAGKVKLRRSLATVTRLHAMIGPMPDSSTMMIASGTTNGLNAGGPTEISVPVIASEISGKKVIQKMTAASATSNRFWNRNTASREISESSRASVLRLSLRQMTRNSDPITITEINPTNEMFSVGSETNAWIELRIPERTRNVPTIASVPVIRISETFQTFSIPRFSWIMIEWMKAVAHSHGISAAFSTGSQAQ